MFVFLPFCRRFCVFCIFAAWSVFGLTMAQGEALHQERLLQRAEAYLNSCDQAVMPYAMVVRGLLHAGFSPDHPFVRSKAEVLSRLTPCNDAEAARQREVALLVRVSEDRNVLLPSKHDAAMLQAAVVSDYCNDHYKRFGIVRLPQRFPGRSNDAPLPQHESGHLMAAVSVATSLPRSLDTAPMLNGNVVSSCSSDRPRPVVIGKLTGYILVAQTVRLRN